MDRLSLFAVPGFPLVRPGDHLAELVLSALAKSGEVPQEGDVLVLAQKIVSKAENRFVDLRTVEPSPRARELGEKVDKDPRLVEVILGESTAVVAHRPGVLIVRHRLGLVLANAGVDRSNLGRDVSDDTVLLLPEHPDRSARCLRAEIERRCGTRVGVLINDSLGRPWRLGTLGIAIGCAGLPALWDQRGDHDLFGRELLVTQVAVADELAAAASLVMGQAAERTPVVLVRGLEVAAPEGSAKDLVRAADEDLFR